MTPMPMLHRLLPVLALLAAPYLTADQLEMPSGYRDPPCGAARRMGHGG